MFSHNSMWVICLGLVGVGQGHDWYFQQHCSVDSFIFYLFLFALDISALIISVVLTEKDKTSMHIKNQKCEWGQVPVVIE